MTDLAVRRLTIDLDTPIALRWNGGDAFRSAFFNALSMSFPVGEQYFIDSVRNGLADLPAPDRAYYAAEVHGFIGQEATHRRIHARFNAHLQAGGLVNHIEMRALRRIARHAGRNLRVHLAATAATEHLTAVFADWMLRHPEALHGAAPRLQTLWLWHSAEESEHRSTAFDIHRAAGGSHAWRVRTFRYVTAIFLFDLTRQTVHNLWRDTSLFKLTTWRSAAQLLFARDGLLRGNVGRWRAYLAPDFHPNQHDDSLAQRWLINNVQQYSVATGSKMGRATAA
jgi:predicted metal-dependent hydrolase